MLLKALISNLLARKLKFCEHIRMAPKQKITIIFFEMKCWKCGTLQYCYTVEPSLKSVCNCDFDVERSSWDDHDIDKHPGVYTAVQDFLQTEEGRQLKVGPVKRRYSRTVADSYLSHGCYYCDAMCVPSRPPFFIGIILRLMFVAGGTFPPATAYCFLKVGNAPLSS